MFKLATNYYTSDTGTAFQTATNNMSVKTPEIPQEKTTLFDMTNFNSAMNDYKQNFSVLSDSMQTKNESQSLLNLATQESGSYSNSLDMVSGKISDYSAKMDSINEERTASLKTMDNYQLMMSDTEADINALVVAVGEFDEALETTSTDSSTTNAASSTSGTSNSNSILDSALEKLNSLISRNQSITGILSATTDKKEQLSLQNEMARNNTSIQTQKNKIERTKQDQQSSGTAVTNSQNIGSSGTTSSDKASQMQKARAKAVQLINSKKITLEDYKRRYILEKQKQAMTELKGTALQHQIEAAKVQETALKNKLNQSDANVDNLQGVLEVNNQKVDKDKERTDVSKNTVDLQNQYLMSLQKDDSSTRKSNLSLSA